MKAIIYLLFSFRGRISVGQWWFGIFVSYAFIFILCIFSLAVSIDLQTELSIDLQDELFGLLSIPTLWILFALNTKRLHDRNLPGWWMLIALIPILGTIYCGWQIAFMSGDEGKNKYGPAPKPLFKQVGS